MTEAQGSRKSPLYSGQVAKKLPAPLAKKYPQNNNLGSVGRPRRFSLLYSSDSSAGEGSDVDGNDVDFKRQQRRGSDRAKSISSNAGGKRSKLIRQSSGIGEKGKEQDEDEDADEDDEDEDGNNNDNENSVPEQLISSDNDGMDDEKDSDDDGEEEDDSDSESESNDTSSSEEDIDFVKLQAQRKKRSMKALSALKRDGANLDEERETKKIATERREVDKRSELDFINAEVENEQAISSTDASDMDGETVNTEALSFKFRKNDDGIRFGKAGEEDSEEDIGEEVQDVEDDTTNDNSLDIRPDDNLNRLHVPHFSESEDSEYNIDQDAYFNAIEDEDDLIGIENGLDPNEDEDGDVLREEENMISSLQNDDDISFDGSIRESGSDPEEEMSVSAAEQNKSVGEDDDNGDGSDEEDDEMTNVFDMPFYEDPKFASLYYCEDGNEPRLGLSTSLPLLISDEKMVRRKRREVKKMERKERIQRRKQLKEKRSKVKRSRVKRAKTDPNSEEFLFGVFFNSDQDDSEDGFNDGSLELKKKLDFESPLRRLSSVAASDISSDDEYDNILMDIANIPSSDDSDDDKIVKDEKSHENGEAKFDVPAESTSERLELDLGESDDELQEDSSVTNVFIDIDDLDPDSFYFHYSDDDASSSYSEMMTDDTDVENHEKEEGNKQGAIETVTYANDESTDEDDNLPPPSSRSKNIGTKAKEVVSANVVGLRPPKLGTWETDSKPFTIIDGLSTKSLYPLIQEHQHLLEQQQKAHSQSPEYHSSHEATSVNGDELTLNELLNMSELEDDEATGPSYSQAVSDWYQRPAVPLSAFRNKGINAHEEDEFMLPANSTRKVPIGYIGSERTRRKIDRVKELQRKKNEKKRKLKKKKRLLKLKRERQRAENENVTQNHDAIGVDEGDASLQLPDSDFIMERAIEDAQQETETQRPRKDSVKSVGLAEIHEILGNDNSSFLENNVEFFKTNAEDAAASMEVTDADILTSLTAPVNLDEVNRRPSRRRRQSMVEAAAENLRFTKNGLFSESALADIEGFLNDSGVTSNAFDLNESLQ